MHAKMKMNCAKLVKAHLTLSKFRVKFAGGRGRVCVREGEGKKAADTCVPLEWVSAPSRSEG